MYLLRFLPLLALAVDTAFAQLVAPPPERFADFIEWFEPLLPGSIDFDPGSGVPAPASISDNLRQWSGWRPNQAPTELGSPISGTPGHSLPVEIVFLGETGTGWGRFGYTVGGTDFVLGDSGAQRGFGQYLIKHLGANQTLDVFVETTGGGRLHMFAGSPSPFMGYFGTLYPGDDCREEQWSPFSNNDLPFTVVAFVDSSESAAFAFAVRAGFDLPQTPVPEPSAYGLGAAALLALLAGLRRRTRRR